MQAVVLHVSLVACRLYFSILPKLYSFNCAIFSNTEKEKIEKPKEKEEPVSA